MNLLMVLSHIGIVTRKKFIFFFQSISSIKIQEVSCPKIYLREWAK